MVGQWAIGAVIADLYEVRDVIRTGGMGVVYRVWHREWQVELAVKVPRSELAGISAADDFETEARTWSELALHPNIVSCAYVRRIEQVPHVFAEWVDGGTLADAIASRRLYSGSFESVLARILDIAVQIAWGLDYAHDSELVHFDVKPANIMLSSDGAAKITDFGIARAFESVAARRKSARTVGVTPAYCSPEQYAAARRGLPSDGLTATTDVWSWAVSVLEMFTGERTWAAGQVAGDVLAMFVANGAHAADSTIPAMPSGVSEILAACMVIDPAQRPTGLRGVIDQLVRVFRTELGGEYPREQPIPARMLADSLSNQALSLLDLGLPEQADGLWQQALEVDRHHLQSTYNLALHRWREGRTTDDVLIRELEALRSFHPESHELESMLASIHLERAASGDALAAVAEAERLAPGDRAVTAFAAKVRKACETIRAGSLSAGMDFVDKVVVTPDGRLAVTNSWNPIARIWDTATSDCLHTLVGGRVSTLSVAISADRKVVITGSGDGYVRVWNPLSGTLRLNYEGHRNPDAAVGFSQNVKSAVLSGDGRIAITGSGGVARIWDTASGHTWHILSAGAVFDLALSDDSSLLLTGSGSSGGALWEVRTGRKLHELSASAMVTSVDLSRDGRVALTGGGDDQLARVWDATTGQLRHELTHAGTVRAVALNDSGEIAITAGEGVQVWDTASGRCLHQLDGDRRFLNSCAISADGQLVLTGGFDGSARIWDTRSERCLRTLTHLDPVRSVALSADGAVAVAGCGGASQLISLAGWITAGTDVGARGGRNAWLSLPQAPWSYLRFEAAAARTAIDARVDALIAEASERLAAGNLAAAATALQRAQAEPGYRRETRILRLQRQIASIGRRSGIARAVRRTSVTGTGTLNAAGTVAITSDSRTTLRLWDPGTGLCSHVLDGHTDRISTVAMAANSPIAASAGLDKTVRLWDVNTGQCLHVLAEHQDRVNEVVLSQDGAIAASVAADRTVIVWDTAAGRCLRKLQAAAKTISLSADGTTLVTGGEGGARVWDVRTGDCTNVIEHPGTVMTTVLSGDGRTLITAAQKPEQFARNWTVQIWDTRSGSRRHILLGHRGPVLPIALSRDERFVATGSRDQSVQVWSVETGQRVQMLVGHKLINSTDPATGYRFQIMHDINNGILAIAFGADGRQVITGGYDRTARIWDVQTGQCLHVFSDHTGPVGNVAIDDDQLIALTGDRLWSLDWNYEF